MWPPSTRAAAAEQIESFRASIFPCRSKNVHVAARHKADWRMNDGEEMLGDASPRSLRTSRGFRDRSIEEGELALPCSTCRRARERGAAGVSARTCSVRKGCSVRANARSTVARHVWLPFRSGTVRPASPRARRRAPPCSGARPLLAPAQPSTRFAICSTNGRGSRRRDSAPRSSRARGEKAA